MKLPFFLVISGLLLLASPTARAIVDVNHNGLSDLWEKHHNSGNLFPTNFDPLADPDGDGWTHAQEAAVGSDPFDANPPHGYLQPAIVHIPAVMEEDESDPVIITPEAVTVTWQTLVGKHYTLLFSPDLQEESWIQIGKAFVGSGSEVTYGFEVSGGDKQFWRVAVTDADTDGDTLTDAEERAIGSSPYFPDTDGDGIDDFTAYNSGLNPAGEDSDGDGTPDSALYSVKFELHKEIHNSNNYSGWDYYEPFMGSGDNFRYLTYKNIETYSSSGAALSPDVTDAKRILTYTFLGPGKVLTYPDSHIEYPPPRGPDSQLGEGESRELDPSQTSVVGPTTAPSEIKTVTTTTTAWRIKKQGNTIRSGVHTQVTTAQQILSDGLTYQDYWATYVKPLAWTEFFGGVYGPAPSANFLRGIGSDKWAAETIRDYFSSGNFYLNGIIASPSLGYFGSYGEDTRLKRVRWRWVRFNPLNPFDYEYASPPAAYQKTFHFLVEQTERLGASNSYYGQNPVISTKEAKGIIEIECDGNEGSDWKEISLEKFNTYRIDDPTHLAAMNFTNWGYSTVSFSLLPVEVVPNPLPLDGVARMKLNLISDEFPNLEEDQMPTITIGGEICEDVVQDKEKLATFYFTPPSRSVAGKVDLVLSNITVPAYPLLANGEPLTLTKIIEFTDDLEKGTQGIFDSILVCIDEAKSRALYPLQEDLTFLGTDVDRFMNRMTHISNQGVAMAKTFFEDQTIDGNVESKMNYLANVCQAKTSEVMHELDEGGVILAAAPAAANAANPVFGSPTFFADVKQWLSDNGKNVYESSYSHARFAVINADQFDYTAWTTTTTNDSIYKAMAANPDAKVIINGALFNYQKELATTTGIVYSNGVKLTTSTTPGKKSHTVAELRYWFGQNVDNTPAANAGAANSYKYGGKGHPPVPAAPGANDLHSATGGLVSIIWPDAAGNRKKVTANMDSDLKVYDGFRGPLYGHGVVGVDRDSGMLIILSKDNGITKGLSIFGVQDTLWNSGVDQAVGTDGGSSVALSANGNVRIKGARHFGNVGARETVSNYMIFSLR